MTALRRGLGAAPARAALAGNPSDGYGGAVLAVAVEQWLAEAWAEPASGPHPTPSSEVVAATLERFDRDLVPGARNTAVRWQTAIPRQVGLGGSSAIVIATARALCQLHSVTLAPAAMADFALAVETEELGGVAGLQDRVAQAFGGVTFMDFAGPQARYESLDPALVPELVIAWRTEAGADSSAIHAPLRERHARGEAGVMGAMRLLAQAAHAARRALLRADRAAFADCLDRSFDLRRQIVELDPHDVAMIDAARAAGAAANYTGSGGAIVACARAEGSLDAADRALRELGCSTVWA